MKTEAVLGSFYFKAFFIVLLGMAGLVGGIIVGDALTNHQAVRGNQEPVIEGTNETLDDRFVTFGPGDLFPLEDFVDASGQIGNFEQLLKSHESLLLFVELNCGPCHDLLRFLKQDLRGRLRDDVQVIVCLKKSVGATPPEYAGLLTDCTLVWYDDEVWKKNYGMGLWPTLVGVDEGGFVNHVQFGFDGYLDIEIVERFLVSSQYDSNSDKEV